jgi:hypothetical protein
VEAPSFHGQWLHSNGSIGHLGHFRLAHNRNEVEQSNPIFDIGSGPFLSYWVRTLLLITHFHVYNSYRDRLWLAELRASGYLV